MSGPNFRDLVGDGVPPEEADRLERVHRLLVQAGPPPELPPDLATAPRPGEERVVQFLPKRRRGLSLALAATIGVLAFSLGTLWGRENADFDSVRVIQMHGVGGERGALASIELADRDDAGNFPMLVKVRGLNPLGKGEYYELMVTRDGDLLASCGVFKVREGEPTQFRLTVPFRLEPNSDWYDGWVVVRTEDGEPAETVLTT